MIYRLKKIHHLSKTKETNIITNIKLKMKMRNYKGLILFIKTQNEIKNKND